MNRLNLSEWAITHRALVLFMILLLGAAGVFSYLNLGRAEDPSFTIKVMVVNVAWPGATATEMQAQVADKIEKKLRSPRISIGARRSFNQVVRSIASFLTTVPLLPRAKTSSTKCTSRLVTIAATVH